MKNLIGILGLVLVAGVAQARNLTFSVDNPTGELMPAAGMSCNLTLNSVGVGDRYLPDVKPLHFQLLNPKIGFQSDTAEVAKVSAIVLQINAPQIQGGGYRCEIAGDELAALFAIAPDQRWNGEIAPGTTLVANELCQAMKCGGVALVDDTEVFKAVGSITVVGEVATGTVGQIEPLQALVPFELVNPVMAQLPVEPTPEPQPMPEPQP